MSRDVIYRHRNLVDLDLGVDDAWTRQGGREDAVSRDVIYGHRNLVDLDLGVDDAWALDLGVDDAGEGGRMRRSHQDNIVHKK